MGQQQLLLLVLSTVIVGLATVAGIQAFSENQAQATQDALTQRGIEIANDIAAANGKPDQMGGIDLTNNPNASDIADAIAGYSSATIDAQGAGNDGSCTIQDASSSRVNVLCTASDSPQDVTVGLDPSADTQIQTEFGSGVNDPHSS